MDATLLDLVLQGGAVGVLVWNVVGFMRGWIVPGSTYQAIVREKDEWKSLTLEMLKTTRDAVRIADKP